MSNLAYKRAVQEETVPLIAKIERLIREYFNKEIKLDVNLEGVDKTSGLIDGVDRRLTHLHGIRTWILRDDSTNGILRVLKVVGKDELGKEAVREAINEIKIDFVNIPDGSPCEESYSLSGGVLGVVIKWPSDNKHGSGNSSLLSAGCEAPVALMKLF